MMRVAVVGGGISGLVSAYVLAKEGVNVTLYEKEDYLGGHAKTVNVEGLDLDLDFMLFNRVSYPNMMELFENLGVDMKLSDMSFAISLDGGYGCEWDSRNGLSGLFAQKKNVINPHFWQMLREIIKFQDDVTRQVVKEELVTRGGQAITNCEVELVSATENGCLVHCKDGSKEMYDCCIIATHAPDTLKLLGEEVTYDERRILGAFQYAYSDTFLHHDKNLMPRNPSTWSAWNFLGCNNNNRVCVTFWLNILQNLSETRLPFLVTLNPNHTPKSTLLKWSTKHPVPSVAAFEASHELQKIQGKRGIWFCGTYQGCGFHEDGLKSGMIAANAVLGRCCSLQTNPKHMVPSWKELSARFFVMRFLSSYVNTGCLTLLEEGGTTFTFEGTDMKCSLKCVMRIHNPQFYWKVMTQADLGLADAYINGDFSLVDKDEGLLNLFLIFIANRESNDSSSKLKKNRGWWTPVFLTAGLASANFFIKHYFRKNTIAQSRRNISMHYDLNEDEDLKDAQMRKMSLLIEKARINQTHEILEIGCGWGNLAIEVVKQTGCKCTGITLSIEQQKLAEKRVRDAGLQDHIKILLCDYRQLPKTFKYDRIISIGMIEAVGHEYMEEFFSCCESLLVDDGLLVLEFISIPDQRYDECRRSSDFLKEYIFHGGCLPSLSRITSAMAATSRLCVEHTENVGPHYYQTLKRWRTSFLKNQSKILALGLNEKFIKTWEYYFDFLGAGFKSRTIGNYQSLILLPLTSASHLELLPHFRPATALSLPPSSCRKLPSSLRSSPPLFQLRSHRRHCNWSRFMPPSCSHCPAAVSSPPQFEHRSHRRHYNRSRLVPPLCSHCPASRRLCHCSNFEAIVPPASSVPPRSRPSAASALLSCSCPPLCSICSL
ncbi:Tuberculostearic acid methyltransferase [Arachis hypogaea]|nr:Tuberculostearic acid methyltransferase [Arachis hypogaea]